MALNKELIQALWANRRIRIEMPVTDGLEDGKQLFSAIQEAVPFRLCYVQRLGADPVLIVWRSNGVQADVQGHEVPLYHA